MFMKSKRVIATAILLVAPALAFAANEVSVTDDITLVLPSDSTSYTLVKSGKFDSLDVGNDSFSFSISAASVVDVISADKKNLTNTLNVKTDCEANQSRVRLSLGTGVVTQTVTITPSGNCSTGTSGGSPSLGSSGGGGGGGGGGGVSSATVSQVVSLGQKIAETQTKVSEKIAPPAAPVAPAVAKPSAVALAVSPVFSSDLAFGNRSDDVRRLQEILKQDSSIYPEGIVSGYFGPATREAVRKFQKKYGISTVGRVGPATRAKLQEVFGRQVATAAPTAPVPSSATASIISTIREQLKALQVKLIQEQIKLIQEKLKALK